MQGIRDACYLSHHYNTLDSLLLRLMYNQQQETKFEILTPMETHKVTWLNNYIHIHSAFFFWGKVTQANQSSPFLIGWFTCHKGCVCEWQQSWTKINESCTDPSACVCVCAISCYNAKMGRKKRNPHLCALTMFWPLHTHHSHLIFTSGLTD